MKPTKVNTTESIKKKPTYIQKLSNHSKQLIKILEQNNDSYKYNALPSNSSFFIKLQNDCSTTFEFLTVYRNTYNK